MNSPVEESNRKQSKEAVQDENNLNQTLRIRAVNQAWEDTLARREIVVDNNRRDGEGLRLYRGGVEKLLMELSGLRDTDDERWETTKLGEVTFSLPEKIERYRSSPSYRVVGQNDAVSNAPITEGIFGLSDILEVDWPVGVEFSLRISSGRRPETVSAVQQCEPPKNALDTAVLTIREILNEHDLDFTTDDNLDEDGLAPDY